MTGRNLHLHLSSQDAGGGSNSFTAVVDKRTRAAPGNQIDLILDMSQMHLFDKETERAI
jgi:hypothetical protein